MSSDLMRTNFLNFSVKFTSLISAFLVVAHSPDLLAQTAANSLSQVDAVGFIPYAVWTSKVKDLAQESRTDLSQQIDNFHYTNPAGSIDLVSDRVSFASSIATQVVSSQESGLGFRLALDKAQVQISNFNLLALVKKDLGFGTATLRYAMHCDNISLNIANQNPINGEIHLENGQFKVAQLAWDLHGSKIETNLSGCGAANGFDELLKAQIQQLIEQSVAIENLQLLINSRLTELVSQKINSVLAAYVAQLNINAGQSHHFDEKNNLWVDSGLQPQQIFTADELSKVKGSAKAVLLIKKLNLENFAKQTLNQALAQHSINSKSVEGLNRLTCSRLIQTFVWPSLKALPKCFEMKIQSQVQDLKITDLQNLKFDLKVGAWASGDSQQIAYFESQLNVDLKNLSSNVKSVTGVADPGFIQKTKRSSRISISLVRPTIEDTLALVVKQLGDNQFIGLIKKNTTLKALSPQTVLIELN